MFTSKMVVAGGATLALAAGGVAIADAAGGSGTQVTDPAGHRLHRGFARARLTHRDVHLFVKGRDLDIRIDRGVLQAIGSDSVTLHELDGSDVTIPVDSSSGLGLAIVKELSEAMGGGVSVSCAAGEGTQFVVRLPRV